MSESITVRQTYKYRLYRADKSDALLHRQINVAGVIWNHALKLQKRYYKLTGEYISLRDLKAHLAHLRMHTARFSFWKQVGSQSVQDVLERLDGGYQRFFTHLAKHPPKYRKIRRYKSFTLKQAGWKLVTYNQNVLKPNGKYASAKGVIEIGGCEYKFIQHRPMKGVVKTVTVKRDAAHRLWLCFNVIEQWAKPEKVTTGQTAGFDFGLRTFLTDHEGTAYTSGLHHLHASKRLRKLQKGKDKKPHGTNNRKKAAKHIARTHIRVADKRRDEQFKLANELCKRFDVLVFEDLNLDGMKRLWGQKVSDLAFYQFMTILKHVAFKREKIVVQIGRFERTTSKCSQCGHKQAMALKERTFRCQNPACGLVLGRDHNAAINIRDAGASAYTTLDVVSPSSDGSVV